VQHSGEHWGATGVEGGNWYHSTDYGAISPSNQVLGAGRSLEITGEMELAGSRGSDASLSRPCGAQGEAEARRLRTREGSPRPVL